MLHSTIGRRGQTTIPRPVREALNLKPGDQLLYELADGHVTLRRLPSLLSLKGILPSNKGRGLSFRQIRQAAARDAQSFPIQ
jgi:antitoxin PrlF